VVGVMIGIYMVICATAGFREFPLVTPESGSHPADMDGMKIHGFGPLGEFVRPGDPVPPENVGKSSKFLTNKHLFSR